MRTHRKGLRLLAAEQAQLKELVALGYGATESECARRAIREAHRRLFQMDLKDIFECLRQAALAASYENEEEYLADIREAALGDKSAAVAEAREQLARAEMYSAQGWWYAETERRMRGTPIERPERAVYVRPVPAGHIATAEAYRLAYIWRDEES